MTVQCLSDFFVMVVGSWRVFSPLNFHINANDICTSPGLLCSLDAGALPLRV